MSVLDNGGLEAHCEMQHSRVRDEIAELFDSTTSEVISEAKRATRAAEGCEAAAKAAAHAAVRTADKAAEIHQEMKWRKERDGQLLQIVARHDQQLLRLDERIDGTTEDRARRAEASLVEIVVGNTQISVARWKAIAAIGAALGAGGAVVELIRRIAEVIP